MVAGRTLLVLVAGIGCASKPGRIAEPEPARTGELDCEGQARKFVDRSDPARKIRVQVRCESDRVTVEQRTPDGSATCVARGADAQHVWKALQGPGSPDVWAALRTAPGSRASDGAREVQAPTDPIEPWPFGGGSCSCPWPDDPQGRHCWDDPCEPPEPSPQPAEERTSVQSTITSPALACDVVVY